MLSIAEATINIVTIVIFAQIVDAATKLISQDPSAGNNIINSFVVLTIASIVSVVIGQLQLYVGEVYKQRVIDYIDNLIISKIKNLPASLVESSDFQDQFKMINLFSKDKFINTIEVRLPTLFKSVSVLVYSGIIIALKDPIALIVILISQLLFVTWVIKESRKFYALVEGWTPIQRQKDYLVSLTHDLSMFTNLKVYALFPFLLNKIKGLQDQIYNRNNNYRRTFRFQAIIGSLLTFTVSNLMIRSYYIWQLASGIISLGQFSLYFPLIDTLNHNAFFTFGPVMNIKDNNQYVKHLFNFLDLDIEDPRGLEKLDVMGLDIEFDRVSFNYPGRSNPAINKISFHVKSGEKFAILGHNGSGKTTLIKLLAKYYIPTSGKILINGRDLQEIDTDWWRKQIGYLVQEVPKYYMSVRENIELGDYSAKSNVKGLMESVKVAELTHEIDDLPDGLESMLGKFFAGGVDLSGGQWQKLSIARSIYGNPKVLILDEPTSSIDVRTEQKIFENILEEMKTQTVFIISHKFSNIKNAGQIIVLERGNIIEKGTHKQLMEENKQYAELYNLQAKAFNK